MAYKKDVNKILCNNNICPCNSANGYDGIPLLKEHYCLSGVCEYPGAWRQKLWNTRKI